MNASASDDGRVRVRVPGRVNLIGDHTDYTGGLVLPMAIDRWIELDGARGGDRIRLRSESEPQIVDLPLEIDDAARVSPPWGRYVAGVVSELRPATGLVATVRSTIPPGAGLSSSAALEVAVALALGGPLDAPHALATAIPLARACQRAEQRASGVPCGIMDQLAVLAGRPGHALVIDCHALTVTPVAVPAEAVVHVVHVMPRTLVGSPYADRVRECAAAERVIGPLRSAALDDVARLDDVVARRRAEHVVRENGRVRAFAAALAMGDLRGAGAVMTESHRSLAELFETSNAVMDDAVLAITSQEGVWGARMTGGGFGGCVVALTRPGVELAGAWTVRAVGGAERHDG